MEQSSHGSLSEVQSKLGLFYATMAVMAALAALGELALNRFAVPALHEKLSEATLLSMLRWGALARNLVGLCALGALVVLLVMLVRQKTLAPVTRRMSLGFFGFIVVMLGGTLLCFPEEWLMPYERLRHGVLSASVAVHALVLHMCFAMVGKTISSARRATLWLLAITSLCALGILALAWVPLAARLQAAVLLRQALHRMGEALYLGSLCFAAFVVFPRGRPARNNLAVAVALVMSGAIGSIFVWLRMTLRRGFDQVWYGAFRLEWLLDSEPLLYVPVIAIALGAACGAMLASTHATRLSGAALLLIVAGGFGPPAADRLIMLALGVVMLAVHAGSDVAQANSETAASMRRSPSAISSTEVA